MFESSVRDTGDAGPYTLEPQPRGSLANLKPMQNPTALPLAAGQVLVAVTAVGLNFRDVLNVLGMYPGDPGKPGGYPRLDGIHPLDAVQTLPYA